ncbi:hypothetical protein F4604DRAFT_1273865 [Suillus subluteus]|nr:hypothetical protein F4604DRAFT_1273865 [Suillus subluteus]
MMHVHDVPQDLPNRSRITLFALSFVLIRLDVNDVNPRSLNFLPTASITQTCFNTSAHLPSLSSSATFPCSLPLSCQCRLSNASDKIILCPAAKALVIVAIINTGTPHVVSVLFRDDVGTVTDISQFQVHRVNQLGRRAQTSSSHGRLLHKTYIFITDLRTPALKCTFFRERPLVDAPPKFNASIREIAGIMPSKFERRRCHWKHINGQTRARE